jgi:hypothetical protein
LHTADFVTAAAKLGLGSASRTQEKPVTVRSRKWC